MNDERFVRQVEYNGWFIDLFHDEGDDSYSAQIDTDLPMVPHTEVYLIDSLETALLIAMINVDFFNLADWQERSIDSFARKWVSGNG